MALEATGKLHEIFDTQQISEKFAKREMVLCIADGAYEQFVKFQLTQDKCDLLNQFNVGDEVKVQFNLQGKPYTKNGTTSYFNNLGVWRIESTGSASKPATNQPVSTYGKYTVEPEDEDTLPF